MKKIYSYLAVALALSMSVTSCSNLDESAYIKPADTAEKTLLSVTFESDMGGFTQKSVSGDQVWGINASGYAMISGYVSPTNNANEDWLISPQIDLSNVTAARLTFDHVTRYFSSLSTEATVWASTDYVTDSMPSKATWTQIPTKAFSDPGSWTFNGSDEISLTAFAGKKVRIAFKYISTATKAGTWELKNFLVKSGEAVVINYGKGTKEAPYNVTGAIANQGGSKWVTGYIVGYVWSGLTTSYSFASDTCTQATNIMLAADTVNLYASKCLMVQLPAGVVRNALNLQTTKANLGKKVTLYGSLESYFSSAGLKNTSYYLLDGVEGGVTPVEPVYYESFASNLGQFKTQNTSGDEVWAWNSYKYAMITGYVGGVNKANEDWLISPQIDLAGVAAPKMSFDHVTRYFSNPATEATVWMSLDYVAGSPATATWTQIPTAFTNASAWTLVNSGPIDLAAYANKKVVIAFKYISTTTKAGTWELKNFQVYK